MKSDILIKDDLYKFINASRIKTAITGKICKQGVRPKGSTLEDVVISVIANVNGQIQEAAVNVNIYVADDIKADGQNQETTIRLRELCQIASEELEVGHGDGYRFTLESQQVLAVDETKEHVINNRLVYRQINA
jgi:hypothetical protein